MQEKKTDRRVIKTKKAIRNAFITLLAQKDYNSISIKDIADVADVDRKTVYNYYAGIYEIREELENDLIILWKDAIQQLDLKKHISNPQRIFEILTEIIDSNFELYSNLMKLDAKSYVVRKLNKSLTEVVKQALSESRRFADDLQKAEIAAQFITSGMLSTYQYWFNSDRAMPLKELSREIGNIVLYGIAGLEQPSETDTKGE